MLSMFESVVGSIRNKTLQKRLSIAFKIISYLAGVFASLVHESSAHHGWVDLVSVVWVGITVVVGDDWDGYLSEGVGDGA